jgi:hypothetical protein
MPVKPPARLHGIGRGRPRYRLADPDDLFNMLDGRDITVLGRTWRIAIYSIRDRGGVRWVQLSLSGAPCHLVAVRVSVHDSSRAVIRALSVWLVNPAIRSAVVPVASSAHLQLSIKSHPDDPPTRLADHCHPGR